MTVELIARQIKMLRAHLDVLEAELRALQSKEKKGTFADLRGLLKGERQSTKEEIDQSLFRVPPDLLEP